MPHRDDLEAAQQRIRALEEKVEALEAEKRAPEPVSKEVAKAESRAERRARQRAEAEAARAEGEAAMRAMSGAAEQALATHPTTKDALVAILGGGGVFVASLFVNAWLFVRTSAVGPGTLGAVALAVAMALQATAIPRVLHPVPLLRVRSEDGQTYSSGLRLSRSAWGGLACTAVLVDALVHVFAK